MSEPLPHLSLREWQVMRCCWRLGKATTHDVMHEVLEQGEIHDYRTLQEFLRRIAVKGYLRVTKLKNTNYYEPIVGKPEAVDAEIDRFLETILEDDPEDLKRLERALTARLAAVAKSSGKKRG